MIRSPLSPIQCGSQLGFFQRPAEPLSVLKGWAQAAVAVAELINQDLEAPATWPPCLS